MENKCNGCYFFSVVQELVYGEPKVELKTTLIINPPCSNQLTLPDAMYYEENDLMVKVSQWNIYSENASDCSCGVHYKKEYIPPRVTLEAPVQR